MLPLLSISHRLATTDNREQLVVRKEATKASLVTGSVRAILYPISAFGHWGPVYPTKTSASNRFIQWSSLIATIYIGTDLKLAHCMTRGVVGGLALVHGLVHTTCPS